MENNQPSKGRYPKGHPREGGYCVLWAKQTLDSEKLKNPLIAGCLFKVLCVAQLVDYETGHRRSRDCEYGQALERTFRAVLQADLARGQGRKPVLPRNLRARHG